MGYKNKEEQKKYQREWVAKRRAEYFKDKYCKECDSKDNLELHHVNPDEKVSHSIWSWSQKRRNKELEKCIILCHECHEVETLLQCDSKALCVEKSTITEEQAKYIKYSDKRDKDLVEELNIDKRKISAIRLGRIWKHI